MCGLAPAMSICSTRVSLGSQVDGLPGVVHWDFSGRVTFNDFVVKYVLFGEIYIIISSGILKT